MADKSFQNRRENALRWLEVFRRPIGVGCILQTEDEYKQYLGAIYYILLDIQYQNERIKKTNRWRSFICAKKRDKYTIYNEIGDTHYHRSYTNKLAELCAILKLRHDVKKENYVEPIVLRGDPRFVEYGNGYSYEHYISDKHCQMLSDEIVACMILADARRIDFYYSSNEYIRSHSYEEMLKHYEKELYSKHKEPTPAEIIIGKPLYDGDDVKYTISTGYDGEENKKVDIYVSVQLKSQEERNIHRISIKPSLNDYYLLKDVLTEYKGYDDKFWDYLCEKHERLYDCIEEQVRCKIKGDICEAERFCIIDNMPQF